MIESLRPMTTTAPGETPAWIPCPTAWSISVNDWAWIDFTIARSRTARMETLPVTETPHCRAPGRAEVGRAPVRCGGLYPTNSRFVWPGTSRHWYQESAAAQWHARPHAPQP